MRNPVNRFNLLGLLLMLICSLSMEATEDAQSRAKQVWQLLDYVALNCAGTVRQGEVANESECAETQEFVTTAQQQLSTVPGRWQLYLKEKLSAALNRCAAWFLFSLAFIAVYREVFETVLFYAALWSEGNGWSMLAGLGAGALVLAMVAGVLLRTSARLPISQFFAASSLLVAVLAIVLAGKGIAGLQEAGWLHSSPVTFPSIDILGIYPSLQTLLAQAAVLAMTIIAFFINVRSAESEMAKEV